MRLPSGLQKTSGAGMSKIYLAGPMSGIKDNNYPAFFAAAELLQGAGFEVVNPAAIAHDDPGVWAACMRKDIQAMLCCQTVVLLPGWRSSRGATIERNLALDLDIPVIDLSRLCGL